MNTLRFIDRKDNSREPRPGQIAEALATKLTAADLAAMPGIIQRMKAEGLMSEADENGAVRPLHRRKGT